MRCNWLCRQTTIAKEANPVTRIKITLGGETKQVLAFRLPITSWHEEQVEITLVDKREPARVLASPSPRGTSISSRAHAKVSRRKARPSGA